MWNSRNDLRIFRESLPKISKVDVVKKSFIGKMMTGRHFPLQCWHVYQTHPTNPKKYCSNTSDWNCCVNSKNNFQPNVVKIFNRQPRKNKHFTARVAELGLSWQETFLHYIDFEKNEAIRYQFRRAGNENSLKWMISGEMGRKNYFQNSCFLGGTVELGVVAVTGVQS